MSAMTFCQNYICALVKKREKEEDEKDEKRGKTRCNKMEKCQTKTVYR